MRAVVAGAVLALLLRLVLLLPADLYARVVAHSLDGSPAADGAPTAGWDFWRRGPMTEASGDTPSVIDPGFLRQFVFATWWVGAVAGLVLVWRAGGRATDVACGAVAGAAAGVAGAATLGCLTILLDALPRAILGLLNAPTASPWLMTPLWVVLALACWTFMGGVAGLALGVLGPRGGRILSAAAAPLTLDLAGVRHGRNGVFFRGAITVAALCRPPPTLISTNALM